MTDPANAPGHTDLMVSPESIDAFVEANPPRDKLKVGRPRGAQRDEVVRLLRAGHSWQSLISGGIPRHIVYAARVELRRVGRVARSGKLTYYIQCNQCRYQATGQTGSVPRLGRCPGCGASDMRMSVGAEAVVPVWWSGPAADAP